ncbi:ATP-binding protein [Hymenobacter psychrophilus]|uniref:histidine kinase n=1 Tax=Hymenobacter psychrophilus TaxID=651662 RepID=A0A1H3FJF9_9BACT|nr:ATP-binding protein [Hymenobacter psychrophilus]SDX90239.1 Bacteriophytochrome (light-regulated signal transduction histidine kinase) [Hymenobacter psychrophilus]
MDRTGLTLTDESLAGQPVTLTNCDREPIHIPGAIQPYGLLLCLAPDTHRIVQASANTAALLALPAETLLGRGLDCLFAGPRQAEVATWLPTLREQPKLLGVRLDALPGQPFFKLIGHQFDNLLWLELESVAEPEAARPLNLPSLNDALAELLAAESVADFCQAAVRQVRDLTGFDRVMTYRFGADGSGEVVAEAARADLEPFLGLRYPATDIPQQARAMYLKNWLRFIPDVDYVPVPLVPAFNPLSARPPDMTYSVLRSVSPIHLEYLRNMGVAATMAISVIRDGELWGLIVCHHATPRLVSYELRDLCLFLGKTFSALLRGKEQADDYASQLRLREHQVHLFGLLAEAADFREALYDHLPAVQAVFDCGGLLVRFDGELRTVGSVPEPAQVTALLDWLHHEAPATADVFATNSYVRHRPAGVAARATASGLLAICLDPTAGDYIVWLRPELLQTVTWAGRQQKAEELRDGQVFLSPRQSFEAWSQAVENTATPWKPIELEAAREIRLRIADIRLRQLGEVQARARALNALNAELARSNNDLDSFAYVASHDLKEPLRGIHNYSIFLLEDYADQLDAEGVNKLQTLVRLSQRMEALIESLLRISRVGRLEPELQAVDVNQVVAEVLDLLHPRLTETGTTVSVPVALPMVQADPVRLGEVFNNLITNAMRYNDQPHKAVSILAMPAGSVVGPQGPIDPARYQVLAVRDNGIGIEARHFENIFKLFKRLHGQDKYEGGTGAGLAIVRKMIESLGGQVWPESTPGQGTTFYFTIPTFTPPAP